MARCRICGCRCDASDMVNGVCDDCREEQQRGWDIRPQYIERDTPNKKQGTLAGNCCLAWAGRGQQGREGIHGACRTDKDRPAVLVPAWLLRFRKVRRSEWVNGG